MPSVAQSYRRWVFAGIAKGILPNDPSNDPDGVDLARLALAKRKAPFDNLDFDKAAEHARRAREEYNERCAPPYRKGISAMEAWLILEHLTYEAESTDWSFRGGENNKKVVLAVLEKAREMKNTRFDAGDREMAARAGLGEKSYQRARNRVSPKEGPASAYHWFRYQGSPGDWTRDKQGRMVRKAGTYRINDRRTVDWYGSGDPRNWPQQEVRDTFDKLQPPEVSPMRVAPAPLVKAKYPSWEEHLAGECAEPSILETEEASVVECGWCGGLFSAPPGEAVA